MPPRDQQPADADAAAAERPRHLARSPRRARSALRRRQGLPDVRSRLAETFDAPGWQHYS